MTWLLQSVALFGCLCCDFGFLHDVEYNLSWSSRGWVYSFLEAHSDVQRSGASVEHKSDTKRSQCHIYSLLTQFGRSSCDRPCDSSTRIHKYRGYCGVLLGKKAGSRGLGVRKRASVVDICWRDQRKTSRGYSSHQIYRETEESQRLKESRVGGHGYAIPRVSNFRVRQGVTTSST